MIVSFPAIKLKVLTAYCRTRVYRVWYGGWYYGWVVLSAQGRVPSLLLEAIQLYRPDNIGQIRGARTAGSMYTTYVDEMLLRTSACNQRQDRPGKKKTSPSRGDSEFYQYL
ncbi:hypothetical protein B0T13DRAFT_450048 [Neurospora crassa]|nr:hypothetical protein B0T13DRAFT_450048 [Neurospora crassa]